MAACRCSAVPYLAFSFLADRPIRAQDSTAIPAIMPARIKSSAITARDAEMRGQE
jgi:hypothetical protein